MLHCSSMYIKILLMETLLLIIQYNNCERFWLYSSSCCVQDRTKVSFMVEDACHLPELGQFGCVLAANLICRLPDSRLFLEKLSDLLVPGGILLITSPYSWSQDFTPQV